MRLGIIGLPGSGKIYGIDAPPEMTGRVIFAPES